VVSTFFNLLRHDKDAPVVSLMAKDLAHPSFRQVISMIQSHSNPSWCHGDMRRRSG
jgi:hypothetical protein